MRKIIVGAALFALCLAAPAYAASGSATGNGTSTLAGPAGKGKMKSHHKMMKKSHKKAM